MNRPAPLPDGPLALACRGVRKRYRRVSAVDGIDLAIEPGSSVGIIGRNGAGKSTLLRMLAGLLDPDEGSVSIDGQPLELLVPDVRGRMGYVPDRLSAYRNATVAQMIGLAKALQPRFDGAFTDALLARLRLDPTQRVRHLSRGMEAKLALLLATAHRPDLLILDEPMLGLDPVAHEEFLEGLLTGGHGDERAAPTLVIASHDLADLRRLVERVVILHDGRIALDGMLDEIVASTKRLVIRPAPALGPWLPAEAIHARVREGYLLLSIAGFTPLVLDQIRAHLPAVSIDVHDCTVEEAFVDRLLGLDQPAKAEAEAA